MTECFSKSLFFLDFDCEFMRCGIPNSMGSLSLSGCVFVGF